MAYKVYPARGVVHDLQLIEDHLVQSYQDFGYDMDEATVKAAVRIMEALDYIESFATHPHRGTEQPDIRPGLRTVTSSRFIYYFQIDEASVEVTIFAIFFGGMDHRHQIMERLGH